MRHPQRVTAVSRVVVMWTFLVMTVPCVTAAQEGPAPEPILAAMDHEDGSLPYLEVAFLAPGDHLFMSGDIDALALPELDLGQWRRIEEPAVRWEIIAARQGSVRIGLHESLLSPGGAALVGVDRHLGAGTVLQVARTLVSQPSGEVRLGPATATEIKRGFRISSSEENAALVWGIARDEQGRMLVDAIDPRVLELLATADAVEPYITATVRAASASLVLDSVTGTQGFNVAFTNNICNSYYGSLLEITTAPAGATISQLDVSYRVYHSVDVSRFNVSLWRWTGADYGNIVVLYEGSQSGFKTLERSHTGLSSYNGFAVNNTYLLGGCNRVAQEYGYIDSYTLTLYYGATATIDLVADSVVVSPDSIAAGGTVAAIPQ